MKTFNYFAPFSEDKKVSLKLKLYENEIGSLVDRPHPALSTEGVKGKKTFCT